MAQSFTDYHAAHTAAVTLARELGREVGLLKAREYNREVYQVFTLPRPENRCGFELRAQVVRPADPL